MSMDSPQIRGILSDLRRQRKEIHHEVQELRERIEAQRERLEKIESAIASLSAVYDLEPQEDQFSVTHGQFRNRTLAVAAHEFLKGVGAPQQTASIWDALKRGGITSSSKNPINNLGTTLGAKPDLFVRLADGWALVEWQQERAED